MGVGKGVRMRRTNLEEKLNKGKKKNRIRKVMVLNKVIRCKAALLKNHYPQLKKRYSQ